MTNIEKHIQWGIEGGWYGDILGKKAGWTYVAAGTMANVEGFLNINWNSTGDCFKQLSDSQALLDPKFWQAVGKTRGWSKYISAVGQPSMMWKSMWHRFIDHLADGLTIEEALTKLR